MLAKIEDIHRSIDGEPVDEKEYYKLMEEDGWGRERLEKVLGILERDKRIFRPRPGFIIPTFTRLP